MERRRAFKNAIITDPRLKDMSAASMGQVVKVVDELILALIPSCLYKADEQEPVFILRGQDVTAADTVHYWVDRNIMSAPKEKIEAASVVEAHMERWYLRKAAD